MKFILRRNSFGKDGIFGELLDERYNFVCVTLEHAYKQPDGSFEPKLPPGEFKCVYEWSPKFGRKLWEFKDTPGVTEAKFHPANYQSELEGCVGVGEQMGHRQNGDRMICDSKKALERLHILCKDQPEITVLIEKIVSVPLEKLILA